MTNHSRPARAYHLMREGRTQKDIMRIFRVSWHTVLRMAEAYATRTGRPWPPVRKKGTGNA